MSAGDFSPAHLNNVNRVMCIGGFLVHRLYRPGFVICPHPPAGFGVFSRGATLFKNNAIYVIGRGNRIGIFSHHLI